MLFYYYDGVQDDDDDRLVPICLPAANNSVKILGDTSEHDIDHSYEANGKTIEDGNSNER